MVNQNRTNAEQSDPFYKRSHEKQLNPELFCDPTSEYRGTPFWAWNCRLDEDTLTEQIDIMKQMGMGGFHMHVRTGMDSPYLGDEFFRYVQVCVEKAKKEGMLAYLYDEDRWPSGAAGGMVTREHEEYAAKTLMMTTRPYDWKNKKKKVQSIAGYGRGGVRQENGSLLVVYDILLNPDGTLKTYRIISETEEALGTKWYAYVEHGSPDPWFNDAPYADTLCKEAIGKFISITHEAYHEHLGEEFGRTVPSIFTDEPQFNTKSILAFSGEEKDIFLPWTTDLTDTFEQEYGEKLLEKLPELFWELPEQKISVIRYQFHNHIADRFAEAFCRQMNDWCKAHHIRLTGHLMAEESLEAQTRCLGDAMRCYKYFEIPGIDILCDRHEYTTAKQAQSVVHQMGGNALLSELYGVTGWDCDFRTYKLQGDWQAVCGVTVRVPHLYWMSMNGEAKRDYPASIGHQSPWYQQYKIIEDHFARVNTAMTRGVPKVCAAVIHPIESYWLHWGSAEHTAVIREQLESQFQKLAEILLFNTIDFDYINECDFPEFCPEAGMPLQAGAMEYKTVIVCGCETLRSSTVDRLSDFQKAGGKIIFIGACPEYENAVPSDRIRTLWENGVRIAFDETAIVTALQEDIFLEVRREDGTREDRVMYQLREDGDCSWLFLANGKNPVCHDAEEYGTLRFRLHGEYSLTEYDTLTGEIRSIPCRYENGDTILTRQWHMHDSLLLRLDAGRTEEDCTAEEKMGKPDMIFGETEVQLEEPNMLLLDMAQYSLNGGPYYAEEELLRIDNLAREVLGIPVRRKEVTQPYLLKEETPDNFLSLRFSIPSETEIEDVLLGIEDYEQAEIRMNGKNVVMQVWEEEFMGLHGWYADKCIKTIRLPSIQKGINTLEITVPIGRRTNLENFYLLGNFGVKIAGTVKTITDPVQKLGFGDVTGQGLPFYTGNLRYQFKVYSDGNLKLRIPRYRGALIKILADGIDMGNVIFSPYLIDLSGIEKGEHTITLILYGTRQNGFAQLHHTPGIWFYQSPNSWRSEGDLWCYEYQLKEAGILKSPEIYHGYALGADGQRRTSVAESKSSIADIKW